MGAFYTDGNLVTESIAGDVSISAGTQFARVNTAAARAVTIPTALCVNGRHLWVKDVTGGAAANNITLSTQGAEDIDGEDTLVIAEGYGGVHLLSDGTNWFVQP